MTTADSNDTLLGMMTLYKGTKTAEVNQNAKIVTQLEQAGIPVPDRLAVAVKRGTWGVRVPQADYQAVMDAKNHEEYQAAYVAYAEARATAQAIYAVQDELSQGQTTRALAEIEMGKREAVPSVVDRFNELVPAFVESATSLPEFDIPSGSAADFKKFAAARDAAAVLTKLHKVYKALVPESDWYLRWHQIADIETSADLRAIHEADQRHQDGPFAVLAPFFAVVQNGNALRLVTPDQAHEAHNALSALHEAAGTRMFRPTYTQAIQTPGITGEQGAHIKASGL